MPAPPAAVAIRAAFQHRDFAPAAAVLSEDVVFNSPVLAEPWRTKRVLEWLGPQMVRVLEDVEFGPDVTHADLTVLPFSARRGDVAVHGVQILGIDAAGEIDRLTMYIRPLDALRAVARAMEAALSGSRPPAAHG